MVRLINLISPRACVVCGNRLAIGEQVICTACNISLPRTYFWRDPYENKMAKMFFGHIKIIKAAAMFYYQPQTRVSRIILSMKYLNHPDHAFMMGRLFAAELLRDGFFDGMDAIVPVPIASKRLRKRGYNQSKEVAVGVGEITGIPVYDNVVVRRTFRQSQTKMDRWQRMDNVADVFELSDSSLIAGKHVLIVDDVITTGATVVSCAVAMSNCEGVRFSVLSLGFTH